MTDYKLVPAEIIDRFPEINPSNYGHDDACSLNAWGVELVLAAVDAPAVQGEPVAWFEGEPGMRGATITNLTALIHSTRFHLTKPRTSNPVWPLYTAPQPAEQQPDVTQLVEIAKDIVDLHDRRRVVLTVHVEALRKALSAYRKGGE